MPFRLSERTSNSSALSTICRFVLRRVSFLALRTKLSSMSMFVLIEWIYTIPRYFCASLCSRVPLGTLLFSSSYCCADERVPLFSAPMRRGAASEAPLSVTVASIGKRSQVREAEQEQKEALPCERGAYELLRGTDSIQGLIAGRARSSCRRGCTTSNGRIFVRTATDMNDEK